MMMVSVRFCLLFVEDNWFLCRRQILFKEINTSKNTCTPPLTKLRHEDDTYKQDI